MRCALLALFLASWSGVVRADDLEVSSDRPDFTEGTHTIAPGHVQLEAGLEYGFAGQTIRTPDLLVRVGILDSLEARVAAPSLEAGPDSTRVGTAGVSAKFAGPVSENFELGVLPSLAFPVTGTGMDQEGLGMGLGLLWSAGISDTVGVAGSVGSSVSGLGTEAGLAPPEHFLTLGTGIGITDSLSTFIEVFALMQEGFIPYADAGFTYLISPRFQLDLYGGLAIDGTEDAWMGTGVVVLF